jgi:hypothetical protein
LEEEDAAAVVSVLSTVGSGIMPRDIRSKHLIHIEAKNLIINSGLLPGEGYVLGMTPGSFEHNIFSASKDVHRVVFDIYSIGNCKKEYSPSFIKNNVAEKSLFTFYYIDIRSRYLSELMKSDIC